MKLSVWVQKTILVIVAGICLPVMESSAQNATNSLYAQTSEMADGMINYNADKESIMRFYSTAQGEFGGRSDGYNTPERRQRLLQLLMKTLAC
ncbi:MAG: hypothetical protein WDM90_15925 [Ferruginibacter sp.]